MRLFLVGLLLLGGCAAQSSEIKILKSNTEIKVIRLTINDGDILTCDDTNCKVVTKP